MKKQLLRLSMSFVLLVAASGCTSKQATCPCLPPTTHKPVDGGENIDKNGNKTNAHTDSVWVDEGGNLTFAVENATGISLKFTKRNGSTPSSVCVPLKGNGSSLTCQVQKDTEGDYDVTVTTTTTGTNENPATPAQTTVTAYIRSCKGC